KILAALHRVHTSRPNPSFGCGHTNRTRGPPRAIRIVPVSSNRRYTAAFPLSRQAVGAVQHCEAAATLSALTKRPRSLFSVLLHLEIDDDTTCITVEPQ